MKKRLIISSVISIFLVSMLLLGSTYSIFTSQEIDETANVYKTGNLNVTYSIKNVDNTNSVQITDPIPMTVEEADAVFPYRVTVTNSGNVPYEFDVILMDTTSSEENTIDYQYIMIKVGYLDPIALSDCTNNIIKENVIVPAGEKVDIDVRIWLDSTLPNTEIGKSFYAKLKIDGLAVYNDDENIDNSKLSLRYLKANSCRSSQNFCNSTYRGYIQTASFVDYIDSFNAFINSDTNEKAIWDMSTAQDKSVVAWLEDNGITDENGNKYFDLYIGSKEKIYATSLMSFFEEMNNVEAIYFDNFDTSLTTSMGEPGGYNYGGMFEDCNKLTELDVSNWDISNVITVGRIFFNCSSLIELDVSNFELSKVVNMTSMFNGCKLLTYLDVSKWDTSNVTRMQYLFNDCLNLISIDVSNFDTSNVIDISGMFRECRCLTEIDVLDFDTSNVKNMQNVFYGCKNLKSIDLSNWDTSKVTNMLQMLSGVGIINLDLSNFDTSKVTDMYGMFQHCSAEKIVLGKSFDTGKVTRFNYMFSNCGNLKEVDVGWFDLTSAISLNYMFQGCSSLTVLDVSNWNVSNISDMSSLFAECKSLTELDLDGWDTSNVTNMKFMFSYCTQLTTSITVKNPNTTYNNIFNGIGADVSTSITLYYVGDNPSTTDINESTESLVISMIGSNSKVINGGCVGNYCSI